MYSSPSIFIRYAAGGQPAPDTVGSCAQILPLYCGFSRSFQSLIADASTYSVLTVMLCEALLVIRRTYWLSGSMNQSLPAFHLLPSLASGFTKAGGMGSSSLLP